MATNTITFGLGGKETTAKKFYEAVEKTLIMMGDVKVTENFDIHGESD